MNITDSYSLQAERSGVPTPVDREASVFQNQYILVLGPNLHLKRVPWLFAIGKAAAAWRWLLTPFGAKVTTEQLYLYFPYIPHDTLQAEIYLL